MQQEPFRPRLDAHLHLQTIPGDPGITDLPGSNVFKSFLRGGSKSICNGTSPSDWNRVAAITERYPEELVPCFGVHPWYSEDLPVNWLETLHGYLAKYSAGVGEIGLDKAFASGSSYIRQQEIFTAQLDLAVSMELPVSIHCVRAWGVLLEILQAIRIPVMIHSFSGSPEIMKQLTAMGVFISFSPFLMTERGENQRGVLKSTPIEKVLIESDFSCSKDIPVSVQISDYNKKLISLYDTAAEIKNMDEDQFRKVVYANGKVFTDRTPDRQ